MNIACDARALVGPLTGVGTWTTEIMAGLAADTDTTVTLAASRAITLPESLQRDNVRTLPPPTITIPGTLWLHTVLPRRLATVEADVFVASLAVAPRRCPVPVVVVLNDLTPRTHPHRHTIANRFCFNAYLEESLDRAHTIVAISSATKEAALEAFPWIRSRLHTIPLGVDSFFSPSRDEVEAEEIRRRFSAGKPYILHLGTLEPRKGVDQLVSAWENLHTLVDQPPELVLCGAPGWGVAPLMRRIETSPYRARIHIPGYVGREDVRGLLRHASCFVLASEAEGFGLPLAEAISSGAPCVANDIPPLRETGADACVYASCSDVEALSLVIRRVLDPEVAHDLRARAARRAPDLRWGPAVTAWRELLDATARVSRHE